MCKALQLQRNTVNYKNCSFESLCSGEEYFMVQAEWIIQTYFVNFIACP